MSDDPIFMSAMAKANAELSAAIVMTLYNATNTADVTLDECDDVVRAAQRVTHEILNSLRMGLSSTVNEQLIRKTKEAPDAASSEPVRGRPYKDCDMSRNPNAGQMLNDIRWELHTKLGDVLDEILNRVAAADVYSGRAERVEIMDWIFDVFDKHCGITVQGEEDDPTASD